MIKPMLSVITINYNNLVGLRKTVESVLKQDHGGIPLEYIIVDGDSNDGSKEFLQEKESELKHSFDSFYLISEKDNGIYNAMNKGAKVSKGDWLLFLNSGDCFTNELVVKSVFGSTIEEDVGIIFGDTIVEPFNGRSYVIKQRKFEESLDFFLYGTLIHQTQFIRREAFFNAGGYNEKFKITADHDLVMKVIFELQYSIKYVPVLISIVDGGGISTRKFFRVWYEHNLISARYFPIYKIFLKDLKKIPRYFSRLIYLLKSPCPK